MEGIRGSICPATLSQIEVLGIHAPDEGERRRCAGRWARLMCEDAERILAFQHAWAKRSAMPLLVLNWVIYLALPFSLYPTFIVLPFAILFALSVAVTASTFRKNL